ncbi:hypothetical protein, partial [Kushneria phosphatilytica]|uniref:hypothetical protein n=1 Tax=Kushneria phosphatilytica TaxID=657387 RepID=UPI001981B14D
REKIIASAFALNREACCFPNDLLSVDPIATEVAPTKPVGLSGVGAASAAIAFPSLIAPIPTSGRF